MTRTSDCVFQSTIDGFDALDDTHVVLFSMGQRKAYLAELEGACFDVKSQSTLAAIDGDQNGQICGFGRDSDRLPADGHGRELPHPRNRAAVRRAPHRARRRGAAAEAEEGRQAEAGRKAGRSEIAAARRTVAPLRSGAAVSKMTAMNRPVSAVPAAALQALKDILGPGGWLEAAADRAPFEIDFRRLHHGSYAARRIAGFDRARCRRSCEFCARERIAIVPQGGNTSYCGGATPRPGGNEIVLSLRRMRKIRAVSAQNDSLTAEAGCVLADLQAAAAAANRLLPMSLGSEGSATLGGIVSTNAGGTAVLRYGMMRALVLGLEVVLPDGRVLDQLSALRKDNTGYDVKQLFIGAEGTLGVVTAATLRLFPRPAAVATAMVALGTPAAALELLGCLREALGDTVTTFELMPRIALEFVCRHVAGARDPFGEPHAWYVLVEVTLAAADEAFAARFEAALAAAIERGVVEDAVTATSGAQRDALWRLRETIPEAQAKEGASLKHDISVEPARLPAFIDEGRALLERLAPGARLVAYGHLGDGNLHFNLSEPAGDDGGRLAGQADAIRRAVHDLVAAHGGSISAEHGIGQLKVGRTRALRGSRRARSDAAHQAGDRPAGHHESRQGLARQRVTLERTTRRATAAPPEPRDRGRNRRRRHDRQRNLSRARGGRHAVRRAGAMLLVWVAGGLVTLGFALLLAELGAMFPQCRRAVCLRSRGLRRAPRLRLRLDLPARSTRPAGPRSRWSSPSTSASSCRSRRPAAAAWHSA